MRAMFKHPLIVGASCWIFAMATMLAIYSAFGIANVDLALW